MAKTVKTTVTLSGDFFTHDPGKTLRQNVQQMLDALGDEMEDAVRGDIEANAGSMPYWTGFTADHVLGYTKSPKTGKDWENWAAVGVPTTSMGVADAIRTKAAAASIEARFHPFRKTRSAVYKMRATLANLTRGLE